MYNPPTLAKAATPQHKNKDGENVRDGTNTVVADIIKVEETIHEKLRLSNVTYPLRPTHPQTKHCSEASRDALQMRGRRVVDIAFSVASLQALDFHGLVGCGFRDMCIVREKVYGWKSCFIFKCRVCSVELPVDTEEDCQEADLNRGEVCERVSNGGGHVQLNKTTPAVVVPTNLHETVQKYNESVHDATSHNSVTSAADEGGASSTVPMGGYNQTGTPVIAGGRFANNSYRESCNFLSEVVVPEEVSLKQSEAIFLPVKEEVSDELSEGDLQQCPGSSSVPAWTSLDNTSVGRVEVEEGTTTEERPMATTAGDPTGTEEGEDIERQPRSEILPGNKKNSAVYHDCREYYFLCEKKTANNRFLKCTRYYQGCYARASMDLQEGAAINLTKSSLPHNHEPDLGRSHSYKLRAVLKQRSRTESLSLRNIFFGRNGKKSGSCSESRAQNCAQKHGALQASALTRMCEDLQRVQQLFRKYTVIIWNKSCTKNLKMRRTDHSSSFGE